SSPSSSTGRQACAAIETRIASVTSRSWAPANSFSARKRSVMSRSFGSGGRKPSLPVARRHSASSIRCLASTRRRRQSVSQPIRDNSLFEKSRRRWVVQLHPKRGAAAFAPLAGGLSPADRARLGQALEFAEPLYAGQILSTGE